MPVLTKINTNVIADNAVTAAKIPAGAVDADIGVGSVTASHIAANAVGASELADDAVLPANLAYLGDGSGNLSGTITTEQLRFGTTFTLDDDLTINGDVTLAKVGDDSTGQTLTHTASTARTLTGTGTLRMGSSMSSVEGMTGALGSDVTIPAAGITGVLPVGVTGGSGLDAVSAGITEADLWRLTTSIGQNGSVNFITANQTRYETNNKIGTGFAAPSSGVFTFPSTGIWWITATFAIYYDTDVDRVASGRIYITTDNSSYAVAAESFTPVTENHEKASPVAQIFFDCTSTTTHKVKFATISSNDKTLLGHATELLTYFIFVRLGDT